jgi:hypothetical protein
MLKSRIVDYFMLGAGVSWLAGLNQLLIVPLFVLSLFFPRKIATLHYFTFHAELLPHTEQVVFHKGDLFGNVRRIYVDIKNLEKITSDIVPSKSI